MDSSIISGLIGGAISIAVMTYASARARAALPTGVLRYGWGLGLLGFCCLAFVALAFLAFFYDNDVWTDRGELFAVIGLIVGFGPAAVYVFGEYFLVRGKYDDQGIEFYSPWTGQKMERWNDLRSVEFNAQMSWYVLKFRSGSTIRISRLLSGNGGVLDKLKSLGHTLD